MKARNAACRMLAAGLAVACLHPSARGAAIEDLNARARASFDALGAPRPPAPASGAPVLPKGAPLGQMQDRPSAPMPVGTVFRFKEPRIAFAGLSETLATADNKVECRIHAVSDTLDTRLAALRLVRSAAVGFRLYETRDQIVGDWTAVGDRALAGRNNAFIDKPANDLYRIYWRAVSAPAYTSEHTLPAIHRTAQGLRAASFEFNKLNDDGSADRGIVVRMDCVKHLPPSTETGQSLPQYAVPQVSELDGLFTVTAAPPQ